MGRVSGIRFLWWPATAQLGELQEAVGEAFVRAGLHSAHHAMSPVSAGDEQLYTRNSHNSGPSSKTLTKQQLGADATAGVCASSIIT